MEQNVNQPQVGMSMKNPSQLKEGEFPLAVNGILQSVNGNFAMISNDHSNILATKFKEGFKVIGTNFVPSISTTFFFLVNPVTGESEIGFIYDSTNQDKPDPSSPCPGCDYQVVEDTPLEQTVQNPVSTYYTFVNANCLNFDIDHPVTSWFSIEDCNITMYFNDFKNPPRYIDYEDFQKITLSNCPVIQTDQLDCDKILVFPESCYPIVEVVDVVSGGQNTAGVYQFSVCYADVAGKKITDYFYVTNPTPLYDQAIIPNANTAYPIAKSFKLQVTNLNTDFQYINIAVLKTINNVTSVFLVETFDIKSNVFEYIYTGVDKNLQADLSVDEIIGKRPYYNKAKITTESNGYLFMANLEEDRVLNLQPVVSQIPLRWQTVEMNDGDYANPIIAQNYVGYLGDEVYPFGIAFTKTNGKQTNVFPFVGRAATPFDLEGITNNDVIAGSVCNTGEPPSGRWQVYNTASQDPTEITCITQGQGNPITITDDIDCSSPEYLFTIPVNATPPVIGTYVALPAPGSGVVYPPTNYQELVALQSWLGTQPTLTTNDIFNNDTCDCGDIATSYPAPYIVNTETPNFDVTAFNSSVNIILDPEDTVIPDYTGPQNINSTLQIPPNPSPCADDDDQLSAWRSEKQNWSWEGSTFVPQSTTSNCALSTFGTFYTTGNDPLGQSWYSFLCSNPDGVATITINTVAATAYTLYVYPSNIVGNNVVPDFSNPITAVSINNSTNTPSLTPGVVTIFPDRVYVNSSGFGAPLYALYENLQQNKQYFVQIVPDNPFISTNASSICAITTFLFCIITPTPNIVSSQPFQIPGKATIVKTCNITYQGFPENTCEPRPENRGQFAYWESTETYPCNEEVWGDLAGKPIRHFKFPDNTITPFFREVGNTFNNLSVRINKIYPKGIVLDINHIKLALINAVSLGLITEEEKNQICGYRVYRGNRRGNQSIIAKGLLYDVWQYRDNIYDTGNQVLFPNFPFNDNTQNQFINTVKINKVSRVRVPSFLTHPFQGDQNNKYTFDAPNLSFNNPGLGTEIKLEGEQFGKAIGNYVDLKNNTQYQYIGGGIISAAMGFASIEAAFEALSTMATATLTLNLTIFGSGSSIPLGLILAAIGENLLAPFRIYSHYSEWYEIIKKFAPFRNYAIYYVGVGNYINIEIGSATPGNTRRTISNTQYLKPGILNVKTNTGNTRFNNFKRESSVFIELQQNTFFNSTQNQDTSRMLPNCNTSGVNGNVASYYGSMKNQIVNQYGQIDNIEWIDTGYNGRIEWGNSDQNTLCETIFGGDTYINRFTKKRKVPMFMEDRVIPTGTIQVSPVNQDIQLSLLPNIGYPRYWMDYPTSLDYTNTGGNPPFFGDVAVQSNTKVDYNFLCFSSSGQSWKDAGIGAAVFGAVSGASFGVFSIPIFLSIVIPKAEQDLGSDLFLNGKYVHSFYGITSFLCESDYNLDYRHGENIKEKDFYPNVGDINQWTQEFYVPMYEDNYFLYNTDYSKQNTFNPNFVLNNDYSQEQSDCDVKHPNRVIYSLQDDFIFLANNFYEFPRSGGKLLILKGIENNKVLAVQENRASVFNSYITLETNVATATVGSNTLFNQQSPVQFIQTDLGFGGSQTPAVVSTEFGHYWVDNKRGQVLVKTEGIQNIVKPEEEWWFKENLPFKILKDFPEFDITNNFKYIGMTITYDARYKRIFFTKRDVELRPEYKGGVVQYNGQFFTYKDEKFDITASKYFCNKSWTLSYNPLFKAFVSFHSFTPNYYTSEQAYFSSGVNYSFDDPSEEGLWHHNLTNKSYQVYYGKLKPFIFEFAIGSKYANKVLEGVQYISEFYRFQDNLSSYLVQDKTYNKALVYNQNQTSGLLELVPKQKNNRMQFVQYPKQKPESREILVENIENLWRFNNFFNIAQLNGQPILTFDCDNIAYRNPNPLAIKYNSQYLKDLMRSDYHVVRLINDKYSNYNILQRFSITKTNNSLS